MIACVHQPNFVPWMGFFAKVAAADIYIVMDNVQFPRNSWVNRVRISGTGEPLWLTVPVRHSGRIDLPIDGVEISWESDWRVKHLRTIRQRYAHSEYLERVLEPLEDVLSHRHERLADQNAELIQAVMALCGIERRTLRGSQLRASGSGSRLIAAMCREAGANEYLAGQGAAAYEDLASYAELGVAYRKADFEHPQYSQRGHDLFTPGLSIVDALLNAGPERTRELLFASVRPKSE